MSGEPAHTTPAGTELAQAIAHISEKMQIPLDEVHEIYSCEVSRLAAEARLHQFVSILAIGRTRSILRKSRVRPVRS